MFKKMSLFVSLTTLLLVFCMMCPFFSLFAFADDIPSYTSVDPFDSIASGIDFDKFAFNAVERYFSTYSRNGHQYTIANPNSTGESYVSSSIGYFANSLSFPFGQSPDSSGFYPHEFGFNVFFTYLPIEIGRPFSCSLLLSVGDYLNGATQTAEFSWDGSSIIKMIRYDHNHTIGEIKSFQLPNGVNTFAGFYLVHRPKVSDSSFMLCPLFLSNGDLQYVPFQDSDNAYNALGVTFSQTSIDSNLVTLVSQGINFYTLGFGKMKYPEVNSYDFVSSTVFNQTFRLYYLTMLMMASSSNTFISHLSTFYQSTGSKDVDLSSLSSLLSSISSDTSAIKSALDEIYKDAVGVEGDSVPVPALPQPDYSAGEALDQTFNNYADYDSISNTISSWTSANYLNGLLVFGNILTVFVDTLDFLKMLFSLVVLFIICGIVRGLPYNTLSQKYHSHTKKLSNGPND